jgi:sulfite reductase (NADPH) hemoprotein beta-component
MYRYDEFDAKFVAERVEQFRYQVERRLKGELS